MTIDERQRHQLHEAARRTLGDDAAVTLMEMLPPVGWADVTTKRDLDHFAEVLRLELATTQAGLRTEMAGLRTEMADLRTEVTAAVADLSRRLTFRFLTIAVAIFAAGIALRLG